MKKSLPASRHARLFSEPERSTAPSAFTAHIDGAARGNPGPASYGVEIRGPAGEAVAELKKYFGRATNNVAEYYALIATLDYAGAHGISALRVRSDSELLVKQMKGSYKVKSADLRPLFERARKMAQGLAHFTIEHVPREQNRRADQLANEALDETAGGSAIAQQRVGQNARMEVRNQANATRRVRARYSGGVFLPAEPLDLQEGTEVEIEIRRPLRG